MLQTVVPILQNKIRKLNAHNFKFEKALVLNNPRTQQ